MVISRRHIPRRTILKGVGVSLALPLLDGMVPALSSATATNRFAAIYLPHGFIMSQWTPATAGADYDMPPIMKPLEAVRRHITVLSGLDGPGPSSGNHAIAPASFLSAVKPKQTEGNDIYAAATLDQLIAKTIGQDTPIPSLELATEDFSGAVGACETAYSCLYMNTVAWQTPTSPLPMEINPRVVFEKLFGAPGTFEQRVARMREDRSILDSVSEATARLQRRLTGRDRARADDYFTNIREIERRIQRAEQQSSRDVHLPSVPAGVPEDFTEHFKLLLDLVVVAWQADLTRVVTFMMARDLHARAYPEIGVVEGHHPLSHHAEDPEKMQKFAVINTYHTKLFADFVERLRTTPDGDGSMLDHSTVLFGSGMSTGNRHDYISLPLVVAGSGAGTLKPGRHLAHPNGTPHGNLLLTLGQKAGVPIEKIGISTGTVDL